MSTENDDIVPDSEGCPSDDARNDQNATDEEVTPSQYKMLRRDDDDDDEKANESEGSSEEYQEKMKLIDRDAALQFDCKKFIRRIDAMVDQLRTIMHVQMEHEGSKRKRGAEMPVPQPKRRAPFTPPRKVSIAVKATQQP
jgi:hypothetical protein